MNLAIFISTLFGVGYFPKAPGTAGTVVAACIYWLLPISWLVEFPANLIFLISVLVFSLISVFFISKAEEKLGHDSGKIVIDEFLGYMIAVAFLPKTFFMLILSFILFRIFDIFKPEPVNMLQKLPRGWGVLADDLMAGIYSNLAIRFILIVK
ncbi:MAG: phosphatidylglycerophosphatase A [Candidatus Cloacimonetes bacterium]|nr:phosphatidylglycerophosphatase A [Candidatus Cloacimonadota bacterium]MCF7814996.1 phosphatidylglycerophosphatase A [Candidatus Cloacimonadota bacterium]MCF7868412.1 phosphatidylglycerophosphatase A [Candidatus Cloacimonadota bacterium]MCF7883885.1 phosphatidylglycerophosphatase A [Candidatus Cloacimonadota bacterium]